MSTHEIRPLLMEIVAKNNSRLSPTFFSHELTSKLMSQQPGTGSRDSLPDAINFRHEATTFDFGESSMLASSICAKL